MSFILPKMLFLLLLIPLFVLFYLRLQRQRQQLSARYGMLGMVQNAAKQPLGLRRHIPPVLFLIGLTILLLSFARPEAVVALPRREGTVILAFDVSASMAATDLEPTRMEVAKAAARSFVQKQPPSVQIGVVAFSEGGFMVQVPTNEQEKILGVIDRLKPQRGSSLGQGILAALNAIFMKDEESAQESAQGKGEPTTSLSSNSAPTGRSLPAPEEEQSPAVIVLLSDGENTAPPDPFEAASAALQRGVRIHTVGIGSAQGATLHIEGFTVHTQLDEAVLQKIAQLTGGSYYYAPDEKELFSIYENLDSQLVIEPEKTDVSALFAGTSMLVLLIGGTCSLVWFSRFP